MTGMTEVVAVMETGMEIVTGTEIVMRETIEIDLVVIGVVAMANVTATRIDITVTTGKTAKRCHTHEEKLEGCPLKLLKFHRNSVMPLIKQNYLKDDRIEI